MPSHSVGSWILGCIARMGWLNRMTQFKEKAGKDKEKASVGLYIYPILMAADILLYDSTHVPVGEDQKQHLELSRDIAQKFNLDFKAPDFLKSPEPLIQKSFARIMSLKDGVKKMSKSDPSDFSRINLTDNKDEIINKINEVLDAKVRPAVARDGGDITFKSFKDGVVTVELKGSCSGCPSSIMTLKQGVQNLLCHYIPEVKSVEAS